MRSYAAKESRDKSKTRSEPTETALSGFSTVIELGLEPRTYSLEGCCSIQLSYSTIPLIFGKGTKNIRLRKKNLSSSDGIPDGSRRD